MSTFLELCKATRQEVGIPGDGPLSTAGQKGELKKIVDWVSKAWTEIQTMRRDWSFMWVEFVASWPALQSTQNVEGVARWDKYSFCYYPTGEPERKQALSWMEYPEFQHFYERRPLSTDAQYPTYITAAPDGSLRLNVIPSSGFTLMGKYYRTTQTLDADAEIPILPYDYHDWIMWRAVKKYAANDEATLIYQDARDNVKDWEKRAIREFVPIPRTGVAPSIGEY